MSVDVPFFFTELGAYPIFALGDLISPQILTTDVYLILHTIFNLEKGIEIPLKFHFNEAR